MQLEYTARFADLGVTFQDFIVHELYDQWQWKIDPYLTPDAAFPFRHITVKRSRPARSVATAGLLLLRQETSGFFRRQVFRNSNGGTLWQFLRSQGNTVCLQYAVSPDWREITLLCDNTKTAGLVAFEYLGQMFPACALTFGLLTFHGVLMEYEGHGVIISAPSGTGKTTHARLWRDYKHALIINGDRAACRKADGVWTGSGLPWSGTSGEQINRSVPVTALVVLERGEQNEAHCVTGSEAFGAVLPHVQCPVWDAELTDKAMELMDDFLSEVPVIRLCCRPDAESVSVLLKALEEL